MNYYEILEVSPNASQEVLKAAYKSLMQRYHPDRNQGNEAAAQHAVQLAQAYEVLSDVASRAAYDNDLKLQVVMQSNVQDRARNRFSPASSEETESKTYWFLLMLVVLIIGIFSWYILSSSWKPKPAVSATAVKQSLIGSIQPVLRQNGSGADSIKARIIPVFLEDINVNLAAPTEHSGAASDNPGYVLSIQTLGVTAGTFDPQKFIPFLEDNKEYIGRKLAEKLAGAKYEKLIKHDGEDYLKKLILDSIGEITNTNRFEKYPSSNSEPPEYYGVVDISLPDSFTVNPQKIKL